MQIEALIRSQAAHFTVTDEAIADQIRRRVYANGDGILCLICSIVINFYLFMVLSLFEILYEYILNNL